MALRILRFTYKLFRHRNAKGSRNEVVLKASTSVHSHFQRSGSNFHLKQYLARFNSATVQVDDSDQKFFVKAFQKSLKVGPFNDSLTLRKLASMGEIRARVEKHIKAEEDLTN
ncbi:hypothetical protein CR513_34117, partial [Mucuna pruriens]